MPTTKTLTITAHELDAILKAFTHGLAQRELRNPSIHTPERGKLDLDEISELQKEYQSLRDNGNPPYQLAISRYHSIIIPDQLSDEYCYEGVDNNGNATEYGSMLFGLAQRFKYAFAEYVLCTEKPEVKFHIELSPKEIGIILTALTDAYNDRYDIICTHSGSVKKVVKPDLKEIGTLKDRCEVLVQHYQERYYLPITSSDYNVLTARLFSAIGRYGNDEDGNLSDYDMEIERLLDKLNAASRDNVIFLDI